MSSSPSTPKQKRGIKRLLKDSFSRSPSRSPSQSPLQIDPRSSSQVVTAGVNEPEDTVLVAGPRLGVSPTDNVAVSGHPASPSLVDPSGYIGSMPSIPIIVEPQATGGSRVTQPLPEQEGNPQVDLVASVPGTSVIIEYGDESSRARLSPNYPAVRSNPETLSLVAPPINQARGNQNVAWKGLRGSLRFLKDLSSVFPQLSLALESLLSCLDGLEVAVQNRQDFEGLATDLTILSEAIERQATEIRERLAYAPERGMRGPSTDDEELVRHYRRIESYFRQLLTNASMSTWNIANDQLVNTRLKDLNPSKHATYDSSISTEVNRRGCTEGTRIGVLKNLEEWLYKTHSSSIYWLNGMAGTGKTTIASTFCERAERRKLLAASFFCTHRSAECRNITRIVPTIAYQLARYSIPFQSALCNILGQNPDIGSKNMLKQFEQLLKEPLQQVKGAMPENIVVVIDALDECEDRDGVELVLDMLFRHAPQVPLKFLITSRPEPEIYGKMSAHAQSREVLHLHDIEKSLVRADIELYLKEELGFMSPPASQTEISQLVERSGTLFIYAATLVRYIHSGKRLADPHKRLRSILSLTPESMKTHAQIDALYTAVLKSALSDEDLEADEAEDIRIVLRTVLFAQEPISAETIAELAEIDDPQRVAHALHPLRSVLHQSEETGLVSTLHASFPDFMFSVERSGTYFFDVVEHSHLLAQRCFLVMKEQLRFNICGLESSYYPDEKIEGIQERIEANISPTLAYASRYWATHLALATGSDTLLTMLGEFFRHRLLLWIEVLNLRRELPTGIDGLLRAQQWLMHTESSGSELILFAADARSFVTGFSINPSSRSTPHLYLSSLPLCPHSSLVYRNYQKWTRGLLELRGSLMEHREAAPLATWSVGSEIQSFALSPDGLLAAVGCLDGTLSILSATNGTVYLGPLSGHNEPITSVAFSSDGGIVASGSSDCSIRVWNAYNGTLAAEPFRGHTHPIVSVSFSPGSTRLASASHNCTILICDIRDSTLLLGPLRPHSFPVRISFIIFSPDGALLASAFTDQSIQMWNAHDGTLAASLFNHHTGRITSLAFTPDGSRLISGSNDKTIRVWNVSDGTLVAPFETHIEIDSINSVAVSPDGKRIVSGSSRIVRVWNMDNGKPIAGPFVIPGQTESIMSVAYSPDGTRVLCAYSNGIIRVWNIRDDMFPPPYPPQDALMGVQSVVFCPDPTHFLSSSSGGRAGVIRIWNSSDGSFITSSNKTVFFPMHLSILSPDGSCIASTSEKGALQVVDTTDGSLVAGPFEVERASLSTFWFSRNNKTLIMGCDDGKIKVCDLQNKEAAMGSFTAHHKRVSSLAESTDFSLLVSCSDYEQAIRVWNITAPALDLKPSDISIGSNPEQSYGAVNDGWQIREDGWVVNNSQHLLFWLPHDIASAWCSPYSTLVITKFGTLRVPKQKLLIGDEWVRCYVGE